jgi:hypothetical protein
VAYPRGVRARGLPDDVLADEQPALRAAVAIVRRITGILGFARGLVEPVQWRPEFAFVGRIERQFGRPAIAVPAAGFQWLQWQPVTVPIAALEQRRQQPVAISFG